MPRIPATLAAATAAALLALSVPSAAHAANGVLYVNGQSHVKPSGCYFSYNWPLAVANHTDEIALIFDSPDCTGADPDFVYPGERKVFEFGRSVYVH
jgi:type 1 fimbria pilin